MIFPRKGSRTRAARAQAVARAERTTALARSALRVSLQRVLRDTFIRSAAAYEREGKDGVNAILGQVKGKAILPFRQMANAVGASILVSLRDDLGLPRKGTDTMDRLAVAGDEVGRTAVQKVIKRWVNNGRILDQAKTVEDSVRSIIQGIIDKALNAAETPGAAEIAKEIENAISNVPYWKAEQIARTEVHTAMQEASREVMVEIAEEAEIAMDKIWASAEDDRTRESHRDMDGKRQPLKGGVFDVAGTSMDGPGDPAGGPENVINCRCVLTYEPSE